MSKRNHGIYIEDSLWSEAQKHWGERGISAAIEHFFQLELGVMYTCRQCTAAFSSRIWDRIPELRGKCIECKSFDLKVER